MTHLPLANLLHHKLRSALSSLGIGISICMLIALGGLARGTLYEVAERWESVDANLIVFPHGWGDNAADKSGSGLADRYAELIAQKHPDIVEQVVPVFTWNLHLGGQNHMAVGVDPQQWHTLSGGKKLEEGRLFDPENRFAEWLEQKFTTPTDGDDEVLEIDPSELSDSAHDGLELVIDTRLADAGNFRLNQEVSTANHRWRIVGIARAGAMARIFMPRRTAQLLFGDGISRSTLMFVKLADGVDVGPACQAIAATTHQDVVPLGRYRGMLEERFGILFQYVDAVNVIAMVIAFLFIMVTLYTMVLQRTRDIAILKSCGASRRFILRQVLAESAILTAAGTVVGVGLSFLAKLLIERFKPLYTVEITWRWIAVAAGCALAGAMVSALYPAWRAAKVDMVEALTLE